MESLPGLPKEWFTKQGLIWICQALGAYGLTITILDTMPRFLGNDPAGRPIPYGILAFWIAWILAFALIGHYLLPKPAPSPKPDEGQ